jgi:lysophospholipase L1-like esterase
MKPVKTIQKLENGSAVTIVGLGDSLTYGWMAGKGYFERFEEMLHGRYQNCVLAVINSGIPGDTAHGGLYRLDTDVIMRSPDAVLVQFGLNDAFTGCPIEQFTKNIQAMIDRISRETNAEIVLLTSVCLMDPGLGNIINEFYNVLDELAEKNNLPIAKVHEYWCRKIEEGILFRNLIQFDGVHPNDLGHRLMAEAVMGVF